MRFFTWPRVAITPIWIGLSMYGGMAYSSVGQLAGAIIGTYLVVSILAESLHRARGLLGDKARSVPSTEGDSSS